DAVERQRVGGLVVGDDLLPGAVEDEPALGRRDDLAQRIGLGEPAVFLRLNALNEPERAGQEDEDGDDRPEEGVDAEGQKPLIISVYAHRTHHPAGRRVASMGSSRRNNVSNWYTSIPNRQVKIVFTTIPCSNISIFCFRRMFTST